MSNGPALDIDMVDLSSRLDRRVEAGQIRQSWEELTRILTRHDVRPQKDGPCFMPARMKPRAEWELSKPKPGSKSRPGYRNDGNIEAVTMVVLDLDKEGAREKGERAFQDLEYVLYSTHSHSAERPYKYRLIMPVTHPVSTEDWPLLFRELAHRVGADLACSNVSRIFYYPSAHPESGAAPQSRHNRGRVLDPAPLIKELRQREAEEGPKVPGTPAMRAPSAPRVHREPAPHFAGEEYLPNPANYRLFALQRRHRASIEQLAGDDSRHHFAMTVIAREISRFGPRTDLPRLLQFLFYTAKQRSSRGMDTGDTIDEIPELVLSAWAKFGNRNRNLPHPAIGQAITDAISSAFEAQSTGHWDFTDAPGAPPPTLQVDAPTEDPVHYARKVVQTGLERIGSSVRLADLASNCLDTLCPAKPSQRLIDELTEAADQIRPSHGPWSEEQFRRFWRGALARAAVRTRSPEPAAQP